MHPSRQPSDAIGFGLADMAVLTGPSMGCSRYAHIRKWLESGKITK